VLVTSGRPYRPVLLALKIRWRYLSDQ